MIFDTHVHYDDEQFDSDREELLSALTAAGIGAAVDVGSTPESLDKLMEIARTHDHIYAAVGIHPDEVGSITDEGWDKIREYLSRLSDCRTVVRPSGTEPKIRILAEAATEEVAKTRAEEIKKYVMERIQ